MSTTGRLRDAVLRGKATLAAGRAKLYAQHQAGSPGIQLCNHLTDLLESVVLDLFQTAIADLGATAALDTDLALVGHGGYGRQDLSPFSDVDLALFHVPQAASLATVLANRLISDLSDVGLAYGIYLFTPRDACEKALADAEVFTSLVECRHVAGSQALLEQFWSRFQRVTRKKWAATALRVERARMAERQKFGQTVSMLEPNIKRSLGGLRDVHLLRWLGFARYCQNHPDALRMRGHLSAGDERTIRQGLEFLLRLRNELHFHAGRANDVLDADEQVRVAKLWNYAGDDGVLPVERFMQRYFAHTSRIRDVVENFRAQIRQRPAWLTALAPLVTHRLDGDYRIGPVHISVTRRGLKRLDGNLAELLRLMDLANQTGKRIDLATWRAVREKTVENQRLVVDREAAERFVSLLSYTAHLGGLLRRMHELGVLELFVAGMKQARALLQFNRYHKYTVDEHSMLAVEKATEFLSDAGLIGSVYRRLEDRAMLHLALLVHDLGKGRPGDHSQVGAELAGETARILGLSPRRTELLQFLVRQHLLMAHLALWRDPNVPETMLQFATEVGSPEKLRMLFLLTAADLAAVGPDVLNAWKTELLSKFYQRALYFLQGGETGSTREVDICERQRQELLHQVPAEDRAWYDRQIKKLHHAYLLETDSAAILQDLERLQQLDAQVVDTWSRYCPDRQVTEYVVALREDRVPGVFHRITGALTSQRLEILSASIQTLADGLILDRFFVQDPDFAQAPPPERRQTVAQSIRSALESAAEEAPRFRKIWQPAAGQSRQFHRLPTRVAIDNSTLPDMTIIDLFTHDRTGLLYATTRTLFELQLSVSYAKIGTHLDQVVDVFYVTDIQGGKVRDERRLEQIRQSLLNAIDQS